MKRLKAFWASSEALTEIFWLFLFLTWVPVIFGQNLLPFFGGNDVYPLILADQKWTIHPALGIFAAIAFAQLLIVIKLRKLALLIPVVFAAYSCFIFLFNTNTDWTLLTSGYYYAYLLLFVLTVFVFLGFGHILSASFKFFLILLILDAVIFHLHEFLVPDVGTAFSLLSLAYHNYAPTFVSTIIFVFALVLSRVLYRAWNDNRDLFRQVREQNIKNTAWETLRLWWPMPVIFAVFLVAYGLIFAIADDRASKALYAELPDQEMPENANLQDALRAFSDVKVAENAAVINSGIETTTAQIQEQSAATPGEITSSLAGATRGRLPGTQTDPCGFLDVFCYISNGIKSMANSAYQNARRKAISSLEQDLRAADQRIQTTGGDFSAEAQRIVSGLGEKITTLATFSINAVFLTYRTLSWLMFVYSIIILIKTFLMIYARIVFDPKRDNPMSAQFRPGQSFREKAKITRKNSAFTVRKDVSEDRYYCYHDIQLQGPPPARSFPLGFRFLLPRLLSRRFSFQHVEGNRSGPANFPAKITIDPPKEIIEWKLREGEVVMFRWNDLVGFSKGINFRRVASLSLSSLILGRIIYYSAEGPGTIYFKTLSAPDISATKTRRSPFDPTGLVAWNAPIRFHVDASLSTLNAFLSSFNITTERGNDYVRDTTDRRVRGTSGGILRFVTTFLLPI